VHGRLREQLHRRFGWHNDRPAFMIVKLTSLILYVLLTASLQAAEFDHSHASLDTVLKRFVTNGLVDYAALKASPEALDGYLNQIASVSKKDFRSWTEEQQLAFLLNLYNTQTLRLIIDHYPVKSINDLGNVFRSPWERPIVRLFARRTTLKHLEDDLRDYQMPEIHFAMVRASLGGPELRNEPYAAANLQHQLIDQGRRFLAGSSKNSVDAKKRIVHLSPIFKWFKADFVKKSGSIPEFIQFYLSPELSEQISQGSFKIQNTEYDWSLNDLQEMKK
jgi:hypothetical protein